MYLLTANEAKILSANSDKVKNCMEFIERNANNGVRKCYYKCTKPQTDNLIIILEALGYNCWPVGVGVAIAW